MTEYTVDFSLECVMAIEVEANSEYEAKAQAEAIARKIWDTLERQSRKDPTLKDTSIGFDNLEHIQTLDGHAADCLEHSN